MPSSHFTVGSEGAGGHSMVERKGLWYTDMDSSPGSASDELRDLEQVMGSAELVFLLVNHSYLSLCLRAVLSIVKINVCTGAKGERMARRTNPVERRAFYGGLL